jgi:hypothetical protein
MEAFHALTSLADLPARSGGKGGVRLLVNLGFCLAVVQIVRSLFSGIFLVILVGPGPKPLFTTV